ncbi:hypothetical protein H5410_063589 [Solanum commersonii]|uniref:chalcone synthase n=1 Tax=Solanum commersonii TaxID=4109 RepID=A0A9J5WER4_SOLCO|nr:hypothetical protein H5410_063589 [Solanum commersonii]
MITCLCSNLPPSAKIVTIKELRKAQRAEGPANVLAIGTANPSNCIESTYPDYFFRITNSEHKTELMRKFKQMCAKTMIKKRYLHLTEEILKKNPNICDYKTPSFDARQEITIVEMIKCLCSNLPPSAKIVTIEELSKAKRTEGPATVLAFGTANPSNCIDQSNYPDYFFRITNSEHKTKLMRKFKQMCAKTMIKKRYLHLTEEILKKNPNICDYKTPSFDARQEITIVEPISKITRLIFCTTSGVDMPGADYELTKLLGLDPSVKRFMLYQQGCSGGGTVLRLAKDLAENNKGARVLVVCSELINLMSLQGPSDTDLDVLVGQAFNSDGASAVIIGSDPIIPIERPYLFSQFKLFSQIVEDPSGSISASRHSIFWVAHPGGRAILDQIELKLGLKPKNLKATRNVLSEYGLCHYTVCFG